VNAYSLPAELEELRASVRRLAEERIAPHAAEVDESEVYPWASWEAWRDAGFAGLAFPAKFGGQDGGFLAHAIAVEEVARVCASSSLFTFISKLAMTPVLDHGSDDLRQRYVTRVASGECQGSYCLSEADAGSDVAGMRTRAVRDSDNYVRTGRKMWVTNAGVSDFYSVFAKTDPRQATGHQLFVVEKGFPDFGRQARAQDGCARSPTGEIALDECRSRRDLIGEEEQARVQRGEPLPAARRRAGAGYRAGRARSRDGIRRRPQTVRPRARRFPGPAVHARRPGHERRRRPPARVPRVRAARRRPRRHTADRERIFDGQVVRVRHRDAHDRLRPAAWDRSRRICPGRFMRRQDHEI
jgi:alkylation response protein AidB-like acyl-CoA dehydrogenase